VQTLTEVLNDPQFNSRDNMDAVEVPGLGPMRVPKAPYHMSETPSTIPGNAALLGEHNYEILCKELSLPEQKIRSLTDQGILLEDPTLAARCEVRR
jgi:crotonobetainyl-CoA:carnitine CoA-transferase CaiB-like acyl-CoA transferase